MGESAEQAKFNLPPPGPADRGYLKEVFTPGGAGRVQEVEDAARAWLALAASRAATGPLVVVAESSLALELLWQDLQTLGAGESAAKLPALNVEASKLASGQPSPDVSGERLKTLQRCLAWKGRGIVATCVQALLEPVAAPDRMRQGSERVAAHAGGGRGGQTDAGPGEKLASLHHVSGLRRKGKEWRLRRPGRWGRA